MTFPFFISWFWLFFSPPPVDIDPRINKELIEHHQADILCIFSSKIADLGSITRRFDTKDQKGNYVFNQLQKEARQSQSGLIKYLDQHQIKYRSFFIINAIHIPHAGKALIDFLSHQPELKRLEFNEPYSLIKPIYPDLDLKTLESRQAIEWGILKIRADSLWQLGIKGSGAVVGGSDTGVELHPAIKDSYRGTQPDQTLNHNYNWHDAVHELSPLNKDPNPNPSNNPCGLDVNIPCDDHNHGTHTVGTMAATDNQIGVAPEAKWIACRCMERGWGSMAAYLECFQWFLAPTDINNKNPDPSKAPHVVNNSWGCISEEGCNSSNFGTMDQVIKNLKAAGIFITVSAGNSGSFGCSSIDDPPAIYEASFSVGATAINDTIAGFSSRGPVTADMSGRIKPNISAPGVGVRSSIRNGGYASWNGTSMASPHVSGAVALLISAFPALAGKVELLEDILEKTADPKTIRFVCGKDSAAAVPNIVYGYGRLNVYKAYLYAKQLLISGTSDPKPVALKVYPNPFNRQMIIDFEESVLVKKIFIYDVYGHLIYRRSESHVSSLRIDTPDWLPGIYFYKIETNKGVNQGKVVLVR